MDKADKLTLLKQLQQAWKYDIKKVWVVIAAVSALLGYSADNISDPIYKYFMGDVQTQINESIDKHVKEYHTKPQDTEKSGEIKF